MRFLLLVLLCILTGAGGVAQSAEELISQAIRKTGGTSKWGALNGFRIVAKFDQGGVEFPLEIVQMKDGRQYTLIDFQGTEIKQGVYDGTVLWSTDFQTQDPKKADPETTANVRLDINDFPDDLYNYQGKGYQVEIIGNTNFEGTECIKLKLTKEPIIVNGKNAEDLVFYYFDSNTQLPIAKEFEIKHGPIQGSTMVIRMDDFREIDGLLFPFSMSQGVKDAPPQPLTVESIELNPKIDPMQFRYPGK